MAPAGRLLFVDVGRTVAVLLAVTAHYLNSAGVYARLEGPTLIVKQFTMMATPLFVFMFGFLIEFIYAERAKRFGIGSQTRRLVVRSFQCYLAYLLTVLATWVGGHADGSQALKATIFFADARYGNILRVYACILLAVPALLWLRLRLGPWFVYGCFLAALLLAPLLFAFKSADFGSWNHLLNVLFGIGPKRGGPSVVHSTTFIFAGMFLAAGLRTGGPGLRGFYLHAAVLLVTVTAAVWPLTTHTAGELWLNFANTQYRIHNLREYFGIGIFCSVLLLVGIALTVRDRPPGRLLEVLLPLGYSSLITYTLGNVLLNLLDSQFDQLPLPVGLPLFLGILLIVVTWMKRLPGYSTLEAIFSVKRPPWYQGSVVAGRER